MPDPFRDSDAPACERKTPWYAWVAPFVPHILGAITSLLAVGAAAALHGSVFGILMFSLLGLGALGIGLPITDKKRQSAAFVASLVLPGLWLGCVLAMLGYITD